MNISVKVTKFKQKSSLIQYFHLHDLVCRTCFSRLLCGPQRGRHAFEYRPNAAPSKIPRQFRSKCKQENIVSSSFYNATIYVIMGILALILLFLSCFSYANHSGVLTGLAPNQFPVTRRAVVCHQHRSLNWYNIAHLQSSVLIP